MTSIEKEIKQPLVGLSVLFFTYVTHSFHRPLSLPLTTAGLCYHGMQEHNSQTCYLDVSLEREMKIIGV